MNIQDKEIMMKQLTRWRWEETFEYKDIVKIYMLQTDFPTIDELNYFTSMIPDSTTFNEELHVQNDIVPSPNTTC
jgi:hypothetical protein